MSCQSYCQIDSNVIRTYFTNNLYGSTVRFKCKRGYTRDTGDETRRCQADGSWSGHPLTCKGGSLEAFSLDFISTSDSVHKLDSISFVKCTLSILNPNNFHWENSIVLDLANS